MIPLPILFIFFTVLLPLSFCVRGGGLRAIVLCAGEKKALTKVSAFFNGQWTILDNGQLKIDNGQLWSAAIRRIAALHKTGHRRRWPLQRQWTFRGAL